MNNNIERRGKFTVEAPFMAPLLLTCLIIFFVHGCSKLKQSSADLNNNEHSYKIAVAAPQFGPYKALGLSIVNGAELAVEQKNKSGGIGGKKIELIKIDDGGLAGEGTWRAKGLVEEMVLGVIGHLNSDISIPASEIYSKAMIPEISPGSTNPFFTERKPVRGYVFRTIGRDDQQGEVSAHFALSQNFEKMAVLYNNRSYGESLASEFVQVINMAENTDIVFYETYMVGQHDFSKEVSAMKEKSPDLVFFVGEYGDAAKFLNQFRSSGLSSAFLGSEGVYDQDFITNAKVHSDKALVISLPEVEDKNFILNYKKKFSKELGSYSANSFDATNILISAIEKVKEEDPEKIAKAVRETKDFSGLTGSISFNDKGDLLHPKFSIYVVKNGMFQALEGKY